MHQEGYWLSVKIMLLGRQLFSHFVDTEAPLFHRAHSDLMHIVIVLSKYIRDCQNLPKNRNMNISEKEHYFFIAFCTLKMISGESTDILCADSA
jgi:hypothetical protein